MNSGDFRKALRNCEIEWMFWQRLFTTSALSGSRPNKRRYAKTTSSVVTNVQAALFLSLGLASFFAAGWLAADETFITFALVALDAAV